MSTQTRIAKTPGVCGGKACIAGHRVRVLDIVEWHEHQGMSPDQIVSEVPSITLADVHAALTYYFEHMDEIRAEILSEKNISAELRPSGSSLIETKLRGERLKTPA